MLKDIVKRSFEANGYKISKLPSRRNAPPTPTAHHKVELIFDVGANVGQYARRIRSEGYRGRIVSFEPLPDAHAALVKNAKHDPLWLVHKRAAVGSKLGEAETNISKNSENSSILPMLDAHSSAAPASAYIGKTRTEVITLDSVFDQYRSRNEKTFLKIDTQGFEDKVLSGLSQNLKNVFGVELEPVAQLDVIVPLNLGLTNKWPKSRFLATMLRVATSGLPSTSQSFNRVP